MDEDPRSTPEVWILFLFAVLGYFLFFHQIGLRELWTPDEDEYALVNREMVEEGHWIYPTVNGEPYSIKPPLFNWIGSAISVVYGEVTEGTSRLPSAIAALLGIYLIYRFGWRLFGRRAGLLAALVLAATPLYIEFARWIQINMISTVLLTLTLYLFWRGYKSERRRTLFYLLMYVPAGIGILNMGFVNAAMPTIVIGAFLLCAKDLRHIFRLRPVLGLLIVFAVAAPWYTIVSTRPGYAEDLIITTNLTRYLGEFAHPQPFYYYLITTPAYFLPWTLLLPGAVIAFFTQTDREERTRLLLPLVWAASLFIFFSCSRTKRSEYMLPIFPALALLAGYALDRGFARMGESAAWRRCAAWPVYGVCVSLLVIAVGLPVYCAVAADDWLLAVVPFSALSALAGFIAISHLRKGLGVPAILAIVLAVAGGVAYGSSAVVRRVNDQRSTRPFCVAIADRIATQERLLTFRWYSPALGFYTRMRFGKARKVEKLLRWLDTDERLYVAMKERVFKEIREELPVPLYVVHRQLVNQRWIVLASNHPEEE